jgi:hypothetical protein
MTQDFKELLNIFNEHEVKYLIVGGYAVMKYTEPRFTKDLDIWVEASPENGKKVFNSLKSFGAPLEGLTEDHFSESGFYQMGRPPVRVDILMEIDGVEFGSAWINRTNADFDGVRAYFIGVDELIINKRASGRLQDLVDIEKLEEAD